MLSRPSLPDDRSRFVSDQTHRNFVEANSKCNATTKWTVAALINPATQEEPVDLNATSRWTVTPMHINSTSCNANNNMENTASSCINSKELCRGTSTASGEVSNKDGAQKKVPLQCKSIVFRHLIIASLFE